MVVYPGEIKSGVLGQGSGVKRDNVDFFASGGIGAEGGVMEGLL